MLLDVGCGNESCAITRHWISNVTYHGIDRENYGSTTDYEKMDRFFKIDLDKENLNDVLDNTYNAVIMSHVIEHLRTGDRVLRELTKKMKNGGIIYIEFPSIRSFSLPSAKGTLNFCDDPTHVRVYDVKEIANILLSEGFRIHRGGRKLDWIRLILVTPLGLLYNCYHYLRYGILSTKGLWELTGFADYVVAEKSLGRSI